MQNFQITAKEDNKKYWISRSMATRSELLVYDNECVYILVNKRGEGVPDFKHCWNIPCGYLEYDITLKENCSKELLEECGVDIPFNRWKLSSIEDDPQRSNKQNVTVVYRTEMTKSEFNACVIHNNINDFEGGEVNEVEDVWLMPLTLENINKYDWAFNHKEVLMNIFNEIVYDKSV